MSRPRNPIALLRTAYRELYFGLGKVHERLEEIEARLQRLEGATRALAADEPGNRLKLESMRRDPEYELAWTEERPLVSVTVATIGRPELTERSLPSVLGQSYDELEVLVAGDGAGEETRGAVEALGDARVRYLDLGERVDWTDDPHKKWLVGATRVRNAAMAEARGRWVVCWDDDDAMRPGQLGHLLELARERQAEAAYGKALVHRDSGSYELGVFPPREGRFSWACGIYHAGLRFLERELLAGELGVPGDWWLAERMLRAGVRFAFSDEIVCDVYPSERGPSPG